MTADDLHRRGVIAMNAGRLGSARRLLQRAGRAAERTGDLATHARVEASLAYVATDSSDPNRALELCERALAFPDLPRDVRGVLQAQRAAVLRRLGDPLGALDAFGAAIDALENLPQDLGKALQNRGLVHLDRHELAAAEADFAASAAVFQQAGEQVLWAKSVHNQGYVRYLAGDLVGALALMESVSDELHREGLLARAICGQDRAEVLLAAGLVDEGAMLLRDVALSYGQQRMRQRQAEAELVLARQLRSHDPAGALAAATTARTRFRRLGLDAWRVRAELEVLAARVAAEGRSPRLVRTAAETAEALAGQGMRWESVSARLLECRLLVRSGHARAAASTLASARVSGAPLDVRLLAADVRAELAAARGRRAAAFEHLRQGLADLHAWQSSFGSLDLQTNVAGHGVRLGIRGLALAVASRRAATLFEWSERARMLASRVQPVRAPQNPEVVAGLAELRGDPSPAREAELRARIRELAWQRDGSREVLDPVALADLQAALRSDQALVAYVLTASEAVALVVTSDRTTWHDLGPRSALDQLLSGLLPDLDMAASELPPGLDTVVRGALVTRLDQLAGILVRPLDLGDRSVVLTPSGALAGVPWTLLPGLAGRPVTVAQSATSWLARSATPLRTGSAGFVAGPRVARAEDEVTAAAKEWPAASVLTGDAATCEAVSALASRVDVLHVAAHGQHSSENPLFSGLQIADGLWFGYDIDQLRAVPDVVLLSACEVGRSTVRWGEELIGMATAWLHAGTRCVIASPAAVADRAAYDALVAVHQGLASGLTPAEALAAAVPPASADRPPVPFLCFG